MELLQAIAVIVPGYLIGSVSFAWILAWKLKGIDLRTFGSGNLGATNAGRLLGRRIAILVYLLDFAKGFVPVMLVGRLMHDPLLWGGPPLALAVGAAAFLGHCFPLWHGFHGGKGVSTASGVILALTPLTGLCVLALFAIVLGAFRFVSLGSITAAIALPIAHAAFREGPTPRAVAWTLGVYTALALLVVARHRKNIRRLLRGEEPRIGRTNA